MPEKYYETGIGPSREVMDQLANQYRYIRMISKDPNFEEPDLPPPPSWFQRSPLIQGRPGFVKHATKLIDLDPYIKQNVNKVTIGPTASVIRLLSDELRFGGKADMEQTNLAGMYDSRSKEIALNPTTRIGRDIEPWTHPNSLAYRNDKLAILAHELAHAAGYSHQGDIIDPAEESEYIYRGERKGIPDPFTLRSLR
jgi:hypothetical protein